MTKALSDGGGGGGAGLGPAVSTVSQCRPVTSLGAPNASKTLTSAKEGDDAFHGCCVCAHCHKVVVFFSDWLFQKTEKKSCRGLVFHVNT